MTSNPGVTPTPPTPEYGREKPRLGAGEEAQEPKPFSLPPEPGKSQGVEAAGTEKPSPMDVARDTERESRQGQMTPDQVEGQINRLKTRLNGFQDDIQNPTITNKFTKDHYDALNKVVEKMNPDLRGIAKNSEGEFNPPQHIAGEPTLNYITRWINGSQETLSSALNYVGGMKGESPNPAALLRLQYSVQRATQRGELFASIIGASVSGIKTIMSTQLG